MNEISLTCAEQTLMRKISKQNSVHKYFINTLNEYLAFIISTDAMPLYYFVVQSILKYLHARELSILNPLRTIKL